jgi:hypothetical protein
VRSDEGDIVLLQNVDEAQTLDLYDDDRRENLHIRPETAKLRKNEENDHFIVTAPIYYLGGIVEADLEVSPEGQVTIKPLKMLMGGGLQ